MLIQGEFSRKIDPAIRIRTLQCPVDRRRLACEREISGSYQGPGFSRAATATPLISLSSLSEPAEAGPELAREGAPRASGKDDRGFLCLLIQGPNPEPVPHDMPS